MTVSDENQDDSFTPQSIFNILDKLKPTTPGSDNLPFWFLRLGAAIFCEPLAYLFNLSIASSTIPAQWKMAVIHPIPKIPSPLVLSDMRPISILPILSRILERLVVSDFLNPSFLNLPPPLSLSNQFAYRATSSTTCALISLLSYVSNLLITSPHVFVISFDYSKAFDTLSHSCVASKLALMDLPDNIYNFSVVTLAKMAAPMR